MPSVNVNLALTQLVPLAEEFDKNKVTPGVLGFVVFAALAGGVWLLMKSMSRHMGRVSFEETPAASGSASGSPSASGDDQPAKGAAAEPRQG
ncbi:hypothetical protein [Streptomyces apocyni]|uniref:hypothetical protein n=1 Tax=Streptomyces apocyni TaxID=2654677 RepID=UPI0012EAF17B|nr:hypothetical protein [Streptomyces apocyni]